MRFNKILIVVLFAVIASSGCINHSNPSSSQNFMQISMDTDEPIIFAGRSDTFYSDINNYADKNYSNIVFNVFDAPFFKGSCEKKLQNLNRKSYYHLECSLPSDISSVPDGGITSTVSMSTTFEGVESMYQQVETISEEEYFRNKIPSKPGQYSTSDGYIEIDSDFHENLPIVYSPGKNYNVLFRIKNVGPGVIENLKVNMNDGGILKDCSPSPEDIKYTGENEITFGCQVKPPETKVLNSYKIIINVYYKYKMVKDVKVKIKR